VRFQKVERRGVVRATSSAAIASRTVAGGRLIPLVMIDASARPEIKELIRVHEFTGAGDCTSQWATILRDPDHVHLLLRFSRPVETHVTIDFELPKFAGAIDNVLRGKALYLLHGEEGSTYTTTQDEARILIEIPETGFRRVWDRIFPSAIAKSLVADEGMTAREARETAREFVKTWRSRTSFEI
jgi:hypothetical protein